MYRVPRQLPNSDTTSPEVWFPRSSKIPHRASATAILLAILTFRLAAVAQEEPGSAYPVPFPYPSNSDSQQKAQFSIGGNVVNSVTGEPVNRALVSVSNRQYAMTDSNGHFQFDGVPRGDVSITAQKPGFFNPAETGPVQEPRVMVSVNTDVGDVTLKLMPQAVIAGRIASVSGAPIGDFPVRLYTRKIVDGSAQWQSAGAAQSDEDGQFRIANLRPGQYRLSAGPEQKGVLVSAAERAKPGAGNAAYRPRGYPQVFYPNAAEFASATAIDLLPGQQFEADFALNQEPLYEISGKVLGVPAEGGVGWSLFNSSGEQLNTITFGAGGQQFSGYVPAGSYTLHFFARRENQQLSATVPLTVASNVAAIQAVLAPENAIPVNIRLESNAVPRPGQSNLQAVVRLQPLPGGLDQNAYSSIPSQQGNAVTYIHGVPPGSYSVDVQAFGSVYVQSASSGATDLLSEPLVVPSGSKIEPIDVVLKDDGGRVTGSVQGQGLGIVLLVPERGAMGDVKAAEVQAGGSFSFEQVRPGGYSVLALEQAGELEFRNADVLAPYLAKAAHVTVSPRQEVSLNLDLVSLDK